ncbi:MAG: hypothetical protein ATN33_06255 [Epulopiscium sp. Nele67-Bin001]|nr:MAG: hypothetical protein BEN18_04815 [Epulopiscium sp. Nuni2H_MBin001]OON92980.1 MAG: hypothetical protein ATN33_06255 [Epulopiscium sp. Nele67-Bin001]
MISRVNNSSISKLKNDLSHSIITNNYDLLSPEVLQLSQELDTQMLPQFQQQLDFYKLITYLK